MVPDDETTKVKERLFQAGAQLFGEKGFDSVPVREICSRADTSMNMVHHYFGSKTGLFDAIVETFTEKVFVFPLRLLAKEAKSKEEFVTLLGLFFEETLNALIEQRLTLQILMKHDVQADAMTGLIAKFVQFLAQAQSKGFLQDGIEPEMISGVLMDRLVTQVAYSTKIMESSGHDIIGNADFRARWIRTNLNLYLYGLINR